jgi:hypothetical protein
MGGFPPLDAIQPSSKVSVANEALPDEDEEDVIGKDSEIEDEDAGHDDSGDEEILVDAEDGESEGGQDVFYDKEVDVSVTDQEIHEGIDFPGPLLHMKDGEVRIENGEQDNDEEGEEEVMTIEIDIEMGFPILVPPHSSAPTEKHILAQRPRWLFASVLF